MLSALIHTHSGLRWILLVLLVYSIINALPGLSGKKVFTESDRKISLYTLIATHLQALIGLGLYMMSHKVEFSANTMSNPVFRFFTVEHTSMMLIAIILITLGYGHAKRGNFKGVFWYNLIALILILAAIPWPFRALLDGHWM
jgi:hypothetical protein